MASLGDARSYFLSTARDDLGVVRGQADDGSTLEVATADTMRNPRTGTTEGRKIAKMVATVPHV